jgi:hypothetical protein
MTVEETGFEPVYFLGVFLGCHHLHHSPKLPSFRAVNFFSGRSHTFVNTHPTTRHRSAYCEDGCFAYTVVMCKAQNTYTPILVYPLTIYTACPSKI